MKNIAVIGLGYVGLPLAVEFGKMRPVVGFDINQGRVDNLIRGVDCTREVSTEELLEANHLTFTVDPSALIEASIYIVTVPTPIDEHNRPNLRPLLSATKMLGKLLNVGDIVIYESTVYPSATECDCVPLLEHESGLAYNKDFFVGYSPERINPGDQQHRLPNIKKITSGSTPTVADEIDQLYASIIKAGTFKAQSIQVAEAAKVIENTQRDLNIALINELAIIFNKMGIDTLEVLKAAETKWNFLPFRPGLVGGHCIGVDPYYLTHKAETLGYYPQVILSGRRINDGMGVYAAGQLVKALLKRQFQVHGARVLILGLAFKENCPDIRNTGVIDLIKELNDYGVQVDVHDPLVNPEDASREFGIDLTSNPQKATYDGIILAVTHDTYREAGAALLRDYGGVEHVFFDLKSYFDRSESDLRL